jgi:hypothetical protein
MKLFATGVKTNYYYHYDGETWTDLHGGYPSGCRLTNGGIRT